MKKSLLFALLILPCALSAALLGSAPPVQAQTALTQTARLPMPAPAEGVAVSGRYAYVADGAAGVQVVDLQAAGGPALVGAYDTPGTAHCVVVNGTVAYVADGAAGLLVLDVSNPAAPVAGLTLPTTGSVNGLRLSGNRLYVANGIAGLSILDVTVPTQPTPLGAFPIPEGQAMDVEPDTDLNRAYVAADAGGVFIVDAANPAAMTLIANYKVITPEGVPNMAVAVKKSGELIYVGNQCIGLTVVNVFNAPIMWEMTYLNTGGCVYDLDLVGDRLYIANAEHGADVYDMTDPLRPALVSSFPTQGDARGVRAVDGRIVVADALSGLLVAGQPASFPMHIMVPAIARAARHAQGL